MRRAIPHIVECKSKTSPWYIDVREAGLRRRKFFRTITEARQELARIKIKMRREGADALELSDELRVTALQISRDLEPFGKTLRDAGEHYLKYLGESQKSIMAGDLAQQFLLMQARNSRSKPHQDDLKTRLKRFCETFGDSPVRTIEAKEIETWLHGLGLSPQSVNNYRDRISTLFSYGERRGYLEKNPVSAIDRVKADNHPPEIFTPAELRQLLESAPSDLLPIFAIGAFAGVRTAEVVRLVWKDIDLRRGFLTVPAVKAKTAKRRLIRMEPNLRAWLAPYADRTGRLWARHPNSYHAEVRRAAAASGLARWPKNGLRHSFASYHLAKFQDAPRLALDMGHVSPALIFANYREIVTPEESERYWQIYPSAQAANVICYTVR